jgi:PAS domain S-box-containing protein
MDGGRRTPEAQGPGGGHDDGPPLTPLAFAVVDGLGTVTGWSRGAEQVLGYSGAEVLGSPAGSLLLPGVHAAAVRAAVAWCRASGSWDGRLDARHRDGHLVNLQVRVCLVANPDGEPSWLVLAADAARPREWNADWSMDRSMLDSLLVSSPLGIGVLDADLRYVWVNRALERFGGVPLAERLGLRLGDVQPQLPTSMVEEKARRVLKTGKPVIDLEIAGRMPSRPDEDCSLSISLFRLDDSTGRVLGVCFMVVDITDRWRARQRLVLLNEAGVRIGGSLDIWQTAQDLADAAIPGLADFVTVDLRDWVLRDDAAPPPDGRFGGTLMRRAGQQSVREGCPESVIKIGQPTEFDPSSPAVRCMLAGAAILEPVLDAASSAWIAKDPRRGAVVREFGLHSLIAVPIRARGIVMGVTSFLRAQRSDPFVDDDLLLANEFVSRAAISIDNARRYTREHTAALALQHSLLPHGLPAQTGVEVTSYYLPSDEHAGVGGDWFDVIPLSGARIALVVGDVVGHGLQAAATMGRLRAAVHTLAGLDLPPDELLARLDDLAIRLTDDTDGEGGDEPGTAPAGTNVLGATCLYAVYDPVSRCCTLARAGHPAPAIASPGEPVYFPDLPAGPPLGLGGLPFESLELQLPEGTLLALYTDGLVESRHHDIDAGLHRLRTTLADPTAPLRDLRERMIEDLLPGRPEDDVAFLLARTRALRADHVATWDLPADPATVAYARAEAARQVTEWGYSDTAFTLQLVVSELVTNAIRHATPPIRLRLIRDRNLICEVSDASSTSPRLRHARTTDEGGRGLFLVTQFTGRWGARYTPEGKTIWTEQAWL